MNRTALLTALAAALSAAWSPAQDPAVGRSQHRVLHVEFVSLC